MRFGQGWRAKLPKKSLAVSVKLRQAPVSWEICSTGHPALVSYVFVCVYSLLSMEFADNEFRCPGA